MPSLRFRSVAAIIILICVAEMGVSLGAATLAEKQVGTLLPEQVPYLNKPQRYPLGNGIAMAVGEASGTWSQLAGPGYTTPNYITSEALTLEVDGVEMPLVMEMKRARKTGVYYGVLTKGDLHIYLVDYAREDQPTITRLVTIDNTSETVIHDVRLRATIKPRLANGMTNWFAEDAGHDRCGVVIQADTTAEFPIGGKTPTDRHVVISFADPACTAFQRDGNYVIETKLFKVQPHGSTNIALAHRFRGDKTPDGDCVAAIRSAKNAADLEKAITDWQAWFDDVGPAYQLGKITDERARNLVEGALAILKTNQSQDGGIIAHTTFFNEGFIRDAALALRGLSATGHFDESKKWLFWFDHQYRVYGYIPDACNCETSLAEKSIKWDNGGNPSVEETALYLLCARDYYAATKDLQTLNAVQTSLKYCMDVQLQQAAANGYKLSFEGDETEICGAIKVDPSGLLVGHGIENWSLSSVAMCAASLDFYMKYLQLCGEDASKYKNSLTGTTLDLKVELDRLVKAMDTDFWRRDVAEIPDGFHDAFRIKNGNGWPQKRIVNFTLMPVYYATPYPVGEKAKDVAAMAHYFDEKTGFLQLVPGADNGFEGHDLGYLLWGLVEVNNPMKEVVYKALVNGPTPDCWGSFNEAYDAQGNRNDHDLRSLETGTNVSAIAKYWNLGK